MSGVDSLGETNEVHWSSSPLSVSVTGKCSLAFTGQPAQTAVNSDILTGFNSTGSPLAVQLLDANNDLAQPGGLLRQPDPGHGLDRDQPRRRDAGRYHDGH